MLQFSDGFVVLEKTPELLARNPKTRKEIMEMGEIHS